MPEAATVNRMFARIADRYDLANRLISFGIDQSWRDRLVDEVEQRRPSLVIDLATGSGDVAFALRETLPPSTRILGLDFCQPMLDVANQKLARRELPNLSFSFGDALDLPLADGEADAVTISFGLRNLEKRSQGLAEMRRCLSLKTGYLYVLEFSQPHSFFRPVYMSYLKWILPNLAGAVTGDRAAYRYLSDSVEAFPGRTEISREIRDAGFASVEAIPLTLGSVALHVAKA